MAWPAKQTTSIHSPVISIALLSIIYLSISYCHGLMYWVGDTVWCIPLYPDFYNDWSSSHLFYVGDSLVFEFETEMYNLVQVTALDYQNCQTNNPIKVLNAGPATIVLNQQGVFYYLCNFSNYCDLGQKITIIVHDDNFSPAPSPSRSPTAESPVTPVFAPFLSREPSTDDCNVSVCPTPSPVTNQAPSLAPEDLGSTMSSGSKLMSSSSCLSIMSHMLLFYILYLD